MTTTRAIAILVCLVIMAGCGKPVRESDALAPNTPAKAVAAFYDAIEAEDAAAVRALLHATKKPYDAFADEYALLLATSHRYWRVMDKRFPGKADGDRWTDAPTMHRLREALARSTITINGDHANIMPARDTPSLLVVEDHRNELIRVGGRWKINVDDIEYLANYPQNLANQGDSAAVLHMMSRVSQGLNPILADIEAGKLATWEEVETSMQDRMRAILKEFRFNQE